MRFAYIAIALLLLPVVYAQTPTAPPDIDNYLLQKIVQEHQNTRQFFSAELTRQRMEFYSQFDERAMFYEQEFFDTLNAAVYKLSLLWAAVVLGVVGLSNMLRITLERKRFRRMKETIKDELKAELFLKNPPKMPQAQAVFDQPHASVSAYAFAAPQPTLSERDGFWARRKKRKIAQEIEAIERERQRQDAKAAMLRQKMGGVPQPPAPQAFTPPQRNTITAEQIAQMTADYNRQLMQQQMEEQMSKMRDIPAPPREQKVEVYH